MLLFVPLVLTLGMGTLTIFSGEFWETPLLCAYLMLDLIFDHFVFGASLARGAGGMELLRSSERGLTYYENVLLGDLLRRSMVPLLMVLIYRALVFGWTDGMGTAFTGAGLSIEAGLFRVLLCFAVESLGLLLARYASFIWINMLIAYAALIVLILGYLLVLDATPLKDLSPVYLCLGLFLALFTGRLLFRVSVRKRKESYHYEK